MMASSSPSALRDRLISNSSVAENNVWLQSSGSSAVSPLRIPKRDSTTRKVYPTQLARRSSSSYNHVKNNNLVSKSPFRSNIPTTTIKPRPAPSALLSPTRRASGEKRLRPVSMHEQAENEHPTGFKRRQSKGFQGLLEKEPVTKSPFRYAKGRSESPPPPPVPLKISRASTLSPPRPSLVTKRFHGPRVSRPGVTNNRRQRRKTVTFDERCDVVEFDREEHELEEHVVDDNDNEEYMDEYQQAGEDGNDNAMDHEVEEDDVIGDHPDSIAGLVDSMLQDTQVDDRPRTPPHNDFLPSDDETEDDIPLGRIHAERQAAYNEENYNQEIEEPFQQEPSYIWDSPSISPSTPPRSHLHSLIENASPGSQIPLGRSPHSERAIASHQEEVDDDLQMLPASPSPTKEASKLETTYCDGLIPSFGLQVKGQAESSGPDPFAQPIKLEDEIIDVFFQQDTDVEFAPEEEEKLPSTAPQVEKFAFPKFGSPSANALQKHSSDSHSPISRSVTPLFTVRNSSASSLDSLIRRSPKVSKEDVQQRLLKQRGRDSLLREVVLSDVQTDEGISLDSNTLSRKTSVEGSIHESANTSIETELNDVIFEKKVLTMKRGEAMSHTGVLSAQKGNDPSPQRPQIRQRAHTLDTFEGLKFDLESDVGFGIMGVEVNHLSDMSALDRLVQHVAADSESERVEMKIEAVTEGVKAGTFIPPSRQQTPIDEDSLLGTEFPGSSTEGDIGPSYSVLVQRPTSAPEPPPKDAIKTREKIILEKRREIRRQEEEESMGLTTPPRKAHRPVRRRSRSAGDADEILSRRAPRRKSVARNGSGTDDEMLDVKNFVVDDDPLSDEIERELRKLGGLNREKYHIKEHDTTIYASSDADQVSHMASAGDVNTGKAWRTVRRPSDMNEYSTQIKEYRSQDKPGKIHGKLFVKIVGLKGLIMPVPPEPTAISCTLNNGIHFVTTPEGRLAKDCRIDQEFELIEHSKLEFTLTFKVKRDPHIVAQFKAITPPPPVPRSITPPPSKGGRFKLFGSPKKASKASPRASPVPTLAPRMEENLARYLKPDGTLARAFIAYKDIGSHCDTRLFETSYPLIGQRIQDDNVVKAVQVGEIVIQIFRLPPLPGVPSEQLPQSLEECVRGLRHVGWHKVTYFEGTLTQNGGDCTTWRRRHFRVIGANLVAYNDVTKRAIATIDLKKALAVEDDQEPRATAMSPDSNITSRSRYNDEFDRPYGVERSFRLIFPSDQEIVFFSDTEEEKSRWLEVLRALIGSIPPNPLWAELLWQRQEELAKRSSEFRAQGAKR